MRRLDYGSLRSMGFEKIREFVAGMDEFLIAVENSDGLRIQKFLENEEIFSASGKNLAARLRYVWGGRHGFRIADFLSIWSAAKMRGFCIRHVGQRGAIYEFHFSR